MRRYLLAITLALVGVVLFGVAAALVFGTPQTPSSLTVSAPIAPASPAQAAATGSEGVVATAAVPAPDPSSPLAIEIPGCVCHSDDPELVEEHSRYRMNQCFGCHADGMPEMGR